MTFIAYTRRLLDSLTNFTTPKLPFPNPLIVTYPFTKSPFLSSFFPPDPLELSALIFLAFITRISRSESLSRR